MPYSQFYGAFPDVAEDSGVTPTQLTRLRTCPRAGPQSRTKGNGGIKHRKRLYTFQENELSEEEEKVTKTLRFMIECLLLT